MNRRELEDRLINFASMIIELSVTMKDSKAGNHLAGQIVRSGTSPALNYGEVQGGESKKDFLHKMRIVLKELRETQINLKIIHRSKLYKAEDNLLIILNESNELISIFVKSVETTERNIELEKEKNRNALSTDHEFDA